MGLNGGDAPLEGGKLTGAIPGSKAYPMFFKIPMMFFSTETFRIIKKQNLQRSLKAVLIFSKSLKIS